MRILLFLSGRLQFRLQPLEEVHLHHNIQSGIQCPLDCLILAQQAQIALEILAHAVAMVRAAKRLMAALAGEDKVV